MGGIGGRAAGPDVDLRVDDSHCSGEVPTQPVSETSTMTPSGPLYFTSTLPPWRGPWPTPSAWFTSSRGLEPAASNLLRDLVQALHLEADVVDPAPLLATLVPPPTP